MPRWMTVCIACALVLLAAAAALQSSNHLIAAYDEPVHIATGLQWWASHRFSYEPLTPPLARMVVAFLPWLDGLQPQGAPGHWQEARAVLAAAPDPARTLLLARAGTLLFLAWSAAAAWALARRTTRATTPPAGSDATPLLAVAWLVTLPPILGNAAMAATDLAQAATFGTLLWATLAFMDAHTLRNAALLGGAAALALLTKFTTLALYPIVLLGLFALQTVVNGPRLPTWLRPRAIIRLLAIAIPVALLLIWACYWFSIGSLLWEPGVVDGPTMRAPSRGSLHALADLPIYPAEKFWRGLLDAFRRSEAPDTDYLLGRLHDRPSVWFFPVALLIKTPIAHLLLASAGIALSAITAYRTRRWQVAAAATAGLCVVLGAMLTMPHLGVRYLLGAYVLLSVPAAQAIVAFWRWGARYRLAQAALLAALVWTASITVTARDNYLGWFNAIAGQDPAWFDASDDLTWWQNTTLLADALRKHPVHGLHVALRNYPYPSELARAGLPPFARLPPDTHVTGWVAIDLRTLKLDPAYAWLTPFQPIEVVANAFAIYDLPAPR